MPESPKVKVLDTSSTAEFVDQIIKELQDSRDSLVGLSIVAAFENDDGKSIRVAIGSMDPKYGWVALLMRDHLEGLESLLDETISSHAAHELLEALMSGKQPPNGGYADTIMRLNKEAAEIGLLSVPESTDEQKPN